MHKPISLRDHNNYYYKSCSRGKILYLQCLLDAEIKLDVQILCTIDSHTTSDCYCNSTYTQAHILVMYIAIISFETCTLSSGYQKVSCDW